MHVKEVRLNRFKRFSGLTITALPPDARLVVLTGPNGSGKSAIIEAFNYWRRHQSGWPVAGNNKYFAKTDGAGEMSGGAAAVEIDFHEPVPDTTDGRRSLVYIRSAYRHEASFSTQGISKVQPILEDPGAERLLEVEKKVQQNYNRLVSRSLADLYDEKYRSNTAETITDRLIGKVRLVMAAVFDDLRLESIGNPIDEGTFQFSKGSSRFTYEVLSGGERAAFDLILDFVLRVDVFDDSIYCLDEPELHIGTRIQAELLRAFLKNLPEKCQLWVATHSIGMMRESLRLSEGGVPVAFIDTGDLVADSAATLEPIVPSRTYWKRILEVALDDLAALVAPSEIFLCEGTGAADGFDAQCYRQIFRERPEVEFVSVGDSKVVKKGGHGLADAIGVVAEGTTVSQVIDGDDHTDAERAEHAVGGVRVLPRRSIECYLLDDEILAKLCDQAGLPDRHLDVMRIRDDAVAAADGPTDDFKKARQQVHQFARNELKIVGVGSSASTFLIEHMSRLVTPETGVYQELERVLFGT